MCVLLLGGEGQQGIVVTLEDCDRDCESRNSVVKVRWTSGSTNVYRLGHLGKVDLKCVQETSGGYYYPEHLPTLGETLTPSIHNHSDLITDAMYMCYYHEQYSCLLCTLCTIFITVNTMYIVSIGRVSPARQNEAGGSWGQEVHILHVNIVLFCVVIIELFPK